MENESVIELPVDQTTITRRYTDKAIEFITDNQDKPFFIYLPHAMPHIPLYVPEEFYDPDPKMAYTRTIEHMDAEVGRLLDALRELDLDENTYVIYTSDNGPWTVFEHQGGSAGPLRGGKGTTFEGGQRVPFIIWGPGRVPAGTQTNELATAMDLLPTIAALTETQLSEDRIVDGRDISALFEDPSASTPHLEFLYYNRAGWVEGIRQGDWKLLKQLTSKWENGVRVIDESVPPNVFLFDLSKDVGETRNLAESHSEIVETLSKRMRELDTDIASNSRTALFVD